MPRPRINPEHHRKNLVITLPPDLIGKAKAYAAFGGETVSAWVEALLSDSIAKLERTLANRVEPHRVCECGRACGSKRSWIAHRAVCKFSSPNTQPSGR